MDLHPANRLLSLALRPFLAVLVVLFATAATPLTTGWLPSGFPQVIGAHLSTNYFTGTVAPSTTVAAIEVTTTGQSWAGTMALGGPAVSDFHISGSNLVSSATLSPGIPYDITITLTPTDTSIKPVTSYIEVYGGLTYYMSKTGNDANPGSSGSPWASVNHSIHCGDVIQAASGNYTPALFDLPVWGAVSCPGNDNVAWLECATPFACSVIGNTNNHGAIAVGSSYWGVQGWVANSSSGAYGSSFAVNTKPGTVPVHHVAFVNDLCTGGALACFSSFGNTLSTTSSDYVIVYGNAGYNGAQSSQLCGSAISFASPSMSDSNSAATHFYVARNIMYQNIDGHNCGLNIGAGAGTTDGEGVIFDTWDFYPFTGTGVVEQNLLINNGNSAFEDFPQPQGSAHAGLPYLAIYRYNTSWKNMADGSNCPFSSGDILANSGWQDRVYRNISVVTTVPGVINSLGQKCGTYEVFNIFANSQIQTSYYDDNWLLGLNGQYVINWNTGHDCIDGSRIADPGQNNANTLICPGNVTGVDPAFATPSTPSAPNCTGQPDIWTCYASTIAGFTPTTSGSNAYGFTATLPLVSHNQSAFICNIIAAAPSALQRTCTPP